MKVLYILWVFACLGGNVYQLYSIGSRYFEYDVLTNVQIYTPELIDVPAVIVCMNSHKLLRWDNFTHEEMKTLLTSDGFGRGHKGENIYKDLRGEDVTNLTDTKIREQIRKKDHKGFKSQRLIHNIRKNFKSSDLFRMTDDWHQQFQFHVFDPKNRKTIAMKKNSTFLKTKIFLQKSSLDRCTLLEVQGRFQRMNYLSLRSVEVLFQIQMLYGKYKKHFSAVEYYLLPSGMDLVSHASSRRLTINLNYYLSEKTLTYSEYRSNLLPPPYTTKCRNYLEEGLNTKEGCFHDCMKTLSQKLGQDYPFAWIFPSDAKNLMESNISSSDNVRMQVECSKKCREIDCSTVIYVPRVIGTQTWASFQQITQGPSQTPIIQSDCRKKVPMIQFFTEAASTAAFWFGLSIMDMMIIIKKLSRRFKKDKTQNNRPSSHLFEMKGKGYSNYEIEEIFKRRLYRMLYSMQVEFHISNLHRNEQKFFNSILLNNLKKLKKDMTQRRETSSRGQGFMPRNVTSNVFYLDSVIVEHE